MFRAMVFVIVTPLIAHGQRVVVAPEFEAASVKVAGQSSGGMGFNGGPGTADPGHFNVHGASLFDLILLAYTTTPYQVIGADKLKASHFDIVAKLPSGANTRPEMMLMLQTLLQTRFRLTIHRELREIPVYELTLAKDGPKFLRVSDEAISQAAVSTVRPQDRPLDADGYPILSSDTKTERAIVRGHVTSKLANVDMEIIINQIRPFLDRPVIDRTGLTGKYSVVVHYLQGSALREGGPNLIEAFQSQLGFKLESKKDMVEVLVIDHAETVPLEQ